MSEIKNYLPKPRLRGSLSLKTLSLVLGVLLTLTGCGFQLRGSQMLDTKLSHIYLDSKNQYSLYSRAMAKRLGQHGVSVLSSPDAAVPTLYLGEEEYSRRILSLYQNAQSAEYEISYTVTNRLKMPQGQEQVIEVQLHRDFLNNTLEALAELEEVELIEAELRTMAVDQIIRELSAVEL